MNKGRHSGFNLSRQPTIKVASAFGLCLLAACVSTQTLEAGEYLVTATPVGKGREAVMEHPDGLPSTEAQCETVKTGVGVNRRAYFLETCSWRQPASFKVCGATPESVEYAFLEDRLVAAMFRFEGGTESTVKTCISKQVLSDGYSIDSGELSAGQAAKWLKSESSMGVTLSAGAVVRVFDAELAPKVHLLRDSL